MATSLLLAFLFVIQPSAQEKPGVIVDAPPKQLDTSARYLFYLHGRIVEDARRPISPQYGPYEYDERLCTKSEL